MASGSDSALQLLTQCPTARRPWYYWVWQMRLSLIYRLLDGHALSVSGQYWGQKFLQGGHYKGRTSCGGDNSWSSSDDSSVMEHRPVKFPFSGKQSKDIFSYSRSTSQQVVESGVESVLWQEDGRVALVEKAYYFLAEKR